MALIKKTRTIAMHKRDSFWKIKFRDPKLSFKPQIFKGKNSYLMKEKQLGFFSLDTRNTLLNIKLHIIAILGPRKRTLWVFMKASSLENCLM